MATFTSVTSGNWNNGATWGKTSPGVKGVDWPGNAGDIVNIVSNHNVTYNVSETNILGKLSLNGSNARLNFSPTTNTLLTLSAIFIGNPWVNGGRFQMGTLASPIQSPYTAKLAIDASGDNSTGPWANTDTYWTMVGDPAYYGNDFDTILATAWTSGQTFTVVGDFTSKWSVNQLIHVMRTTYTTSYLNSVVYCTIASMAPNGGNTDITINEAAPGIACEAGSVVLNSSRNVMMYKNGMNLTSGAIPSGKPSFWRSSSPSFPGRATYKDCMIAGFYALGAQTDYYVAYTNVVYRNSSYGIMGGSGNYGNTLDRCCFINAGQPTSNSTGNKLSNSYFIGCNQPISGSGMEIDNIKILGCQSGFNAYTFSLKNSTVAKGESGINYAGNNGPSVINNCDIYDILGTYGSAFSYCKDLQVNNTYVWNCRQVAAGCSGVKFRGGGLGVKRTGGVSPCTYSFDADQGGYGIIFIGAQYEEPTSGIQNSPDLTNGLSSSGYFENKNNVNGTHRVENAFFNVDVVAADGTGDNPSQRSGGNPNVYEFEATYDIGWNKSYRYEVFEHRMWKRPGIYTIKYYVQTDFASLPATEIYMECDYLSDAASGKVTAAVCSSEAVAIRANQADWSQYVSVTVTTLTEGWLTTRMYVNGYESGKKIWIDPKPSI